MSNELGEGYITAACEAIGVNRKTFYNAKENKEKGKKLTKKQLDVLSKYQELVDEAMAKYAKLK